MVLLSSDQDGVHTKMVLVPPSRRWESAQLGHFSLRSSNLSWGTKVASTQSLTLMLSAQDLCLFAISHDSELHMKVKSRHPHPCLDH